VSAILNAFQMMDIKYLRTHLKEEYTYQDAPKEIFLNEIEAIFNAHTNSGDSELFVFEGSCASTFCDNCGKKGYRFVGKHSRNYFDLIFEVDGDDIRDLLSCSVFETKEKMEDIGTCASIYINEDDLVSFVKTPEYLIQLNQALNAFDELITSPIKSVSLKECTYWVEKHRFLHKAIDGDNLFAPKMKWSDFASLYLEIKEWCDFIHTNIELIRNAVKDVGLAKDEDELISWIIQYEELVEEMPYNLQFSLEREGEFYKTDLPYQFLIKGSEFGDLFTFVEKFFEHQNTLLEKYSTYTKEEADEIYNRYGADGDLKLASLKLHFERRAEAKSLGFEIPLFLNRIERK
jgi:hypothetical protein